MATSDEQLKRAADLKLWIETRIAELQEEVERLKEMEVMVDTVLRASSFRPASEVIPRAKEGVAVIGGGGSAGGSVGGGAGLIPEMRELRRDKGGETIAIAQVTKGKVVVEPVAEVILRSDTPPFKSFLMGKILTGMKAKDEALVSDGTLEKGKEIRFSVAEKGGRISGLTIENYREAERLTEILNTVGWTFSRMLEKASTSSR
ncbi:MAG: hypothetical protein OK474_08790 [Thaumarchaeota archaeon]|nr:hypothetical protein [Nitrososphaerota archaeon]